jgi:hypothetical protein
VLPSSTEQLSKNEKFPQSHIYFQLKSENEVSYECCRVKEAATTTMTLTTSSSVASPLAPWLRPPPPAGLCASDFASNHFALFILVNVIIGLAFNWKRRRRRKREDVSSACAHENVEEEEEDTDFVEEEGPVPGLLWHYASLWVAIVSSPHGALLDAYLTTLVMADMAPLAFALFGAWRDRLILQPIDDDDDGGDASAAVTRRRLRAEEAVLHVASVMHNWSPAFRLNAVILQAVDGDFVDHLYWVTTATVLVTETRSAMVRGHLCRMD